MRREHEMFLFEVSAHDVSSDQPDLRLPIRLLGLSAPPASRVSALLFGFSAFRPSGFSGMEAESVIDWRAHLAVTLSNHG